MVRTIEVHVPVGSEIDGEELAARVRRFYPAAGVTVRRTSHGFGGAINDGAMMQTEAEFEEFYLVIRTIQREARLLETAARPPVECDEDVEGAIDEVRRSARWI